MIEYLNTVSPAAAQVKPSGIRKYFDLASSLDGVISLGVGEPDFVTPEHIRAAGIASLNAGKTQYTSNKGLPALRNALCAHAVRIRQGLSHLHPQTAHLPRLRKDRHVPPPSATVARGVSSADRA